MSKTDQGFGATDEMVVAGSDAVSEGPFRICGPRKPPVPSTTYME